MTVNIGCMDDLTYAWIYQRLTNCHQAFLWRQKRSAYSTPVFLSTANYTSPKPSHTLSKGKFCMKTLLFAFFNNIKRTNLMYFKGKDNSLCLLSSPLLLLLFFSNLQKYVYNHQLRVLESFLYIGAQSNSKTNNTLKTNHFM